MYKYLGVMLVTLLGPLHAYAAADRIIGTEAGTGIMEELTGGEAAALIGGTGLDAAHAAGNEITGATSANPVILGNGTQKAKHYGDATMGYVIEPVPLGNTYWRIWTDFEGCVRDQENNSNVFCINPDAFSTGSGTVTMQTGEQFVGSNLGIELTESDTNPTCASGNYTLYADTSEARIKKCVNGRASDLTSYSVMLPLNPRGAASSTLESITTNVVGDYYLTLTDANTDAADFQLLVPPGSALIGATTATFKLVGVSKNAAPSGDIDFDCAITAFVPGTDTLAAHATTGEVTALLTPATQHREVSVTTSAHTINGGALAAGDKLHGSCEVDATATTSAQMSDFRLWGWVLVTFN